MPPLRTRRSTSSWRTKSSSMRSGCLPSDSSTEDRLPAQAPCRSSSERGATVLRQLQLSGAKLEDTAPRGCQGRVAPGRALSPRWLHRHQPVATSRAGRRLLQQARDVRAMDQGRQGRHQVDAAVMLLVRRQRRASSASCAGLQSRQLHADTGPAGGNQALVVDQPAGKLVKIGAKVVRHGRYVIFQMAEVAVPRGLFHEILRLIAELRPQPPPAPA